MDVKERRAAVPSRAFKRLKTLILMKAGGDALLLAIFVP